MKITEEMVDYISVLSRLKLEPEEKEQMTKELEQILAYMDVLNKMDTGGAEPVSQSIRLKRGGHPQRRGVH